MDRLCDGTEACLFEINRIFEREAELLVKAATVTTPEERQIILEKHQEILKVLNHMKEILHKIECAN